MRQKTVLFLLLFIPTIICSAQKIYGTIKDSETGETIPYVSVRNSNGGSVSNKYGFYSMQFVVGDSLIFSAMGYNSVLIKGVLKDSLLNVFLSPTEYLLEAVTIESTKTPLVQEGTQITLQKIKDTPTLFGESDILKTLLFMPGVTPISEASNGYSVRGGAPNQNLVLLDDAIVYNINHLFGFVSIVNSDAIKNAQFYKSYIPSKYGGRLSSVLDIDLFDGNKEAIKKELTIGLVSSRFKIDGPISDKTTFSVSARASYFGLFLLPTYFAYKRGNKDQYFNYWLFDLNAKVKSQINKKSSLTTGFYLGNDNWNTLSGDNSDQSQQKTTWGNITFSSKYQTILNQKTFINSQVLYSNYHQKILNTDNTYGFKSLSGIQTELFDIGIKESLEYFFHSKAKVQIGIEVTKHYLSPSQNINNEKRKGINSVDNSLFIELDAKIGQKSQIFVGVRNVLYNVQKINYKRIEPRLSWNFKFNLQHSLSISYIESNQFIHQISSNTVGLPTDLWLTSTENIPPQHSTQISLGYFINMINSKFGFEIYNKNYSDLIDFKDGISLYNTSNDNFEEFIGGRGVGKSYGLEVSFSKNFNKHSFEASYTYGKSKVQIDAINFGKWYFSSQDRRHSLLGNLIVTVIPNRLTFASNFIFYTGTPTTVPDAVFPRKNPDGVVTNYPQLIYTSRNNFRFPIYHRADVSFSLKGKTKYHKDKTTSFGIYNIYNHTNPFYLDIRTTSSGGNMYNFDLVKVGILPILPYISYSLKW